MRFVVCHRAFTAPLHLLFSLSLSLSSHIYENCFVRRALLCFKFFIRHSEMRNKRPKNKNKKQFIQQCTPILSYNFHNLPSCKLHSFVIALPPKLFRFNILQGTVSRAVFGLKSTQKMINVGQCFLIRYLTCI